jgi:hypothetical protein
MGRMQARKFVAYGTTTALAIAFYVVLNMIWENYYVHPRIAIVGYNTVQEQGSSNAASKAIHTAMRLQGSSMLLINTTKMNYDATNLHEVFWPSRICKLVEEAKEEARMNNTEDDESFHFAFDIEVVCEDLFTQSSGGTGNWMVMYFAIRMTFAGT